MTIVSYKFGLPESIGEKIYKTGQTRGAKKGSIWQNRVLRNSTVLIPLTSWNNGQVVHPEGFENGYIVLARPHEYLDETFHRKPEIPAELVLGENLLILYETREEWNRYNPVNVAWRFARSRQAPLGGHYIARVPDTTSTGDTEIREGFTGPQNGGQGAGIRVYEYASTSAITKTRFQLAFLAWRTQGVDELARKHSPRDPASCRAAIDQKCQDLGLADLDQLRDIRVIDNENRTICPLCRKPILALELASRVEQAEGRNVPDLTITDANLFHIQEVNTGVYNHRIYNLGWGHHHCNAVARDWGVSHTLEWMKAVLQRNGMITD